MTTKYNINDEVWCMYDNKPQKFYILKIEIEETTCSHTTVIEYTLYESKYMSTSDKNRKAKEEEIYPTKRELLNSFLTEDDKL